MINSAFSPRGRRWIARQRETVEGAEMIGTAEHERTRATAWAVRLASKSLLAVLEQAPRPLSMSPMYLP